MDYCCHIWGKENKTYISKIGKIQTRICKSILDMSFRTHSENIYNELKILSFNGRCTYHTAVLAYKILNNMSHLYLSESISLSNNSSYNLRSKSHRDIVLFSTPRTNYFKDTFQYNSMRIWNSIPTNIRNANSLNSFKTNFKTYLLQRESTNL